MKSGIKGLLLLVLPLCLTACAPADPAPTASTEPTAAVTAAPETTPVTPSTPEVIPEITASPAPDLVAEALFPRSFSFASGAGGWSTELEVEADGSFAGQHYDSDMGDTGETYPYGTVYTCNFHGKFSQPVKVDDYTYSMRLESIEQEETEGEEVIEDGVRYIGSYPYGLDDADEVLIYLPGSQRQNLPEDFVNWTWAFDPWDTDDELSQNGEDELTCYGLYNVAGAQGFVEVGSQRQSE